MESPKEAAGPGVMVDRLCEATNQHDLDALAGCFALDYRNETPVHPARGFEGRAQVRKNWEQIFASVPDITAEVHWVADNQTVWSEWEMRGTRLDGSRHLMRGAVQAIASRWLRATYVTGQPWCVRCKEWIPSSPRSTASSAPAV